MTTTRLRDPYRGKDPRLIPAYDRHTVSHYLRIPESTVYNWAHGYQLPSGKLTAPMVQMDDESGTYFSFANLIELHVLAALRRDHRVPLIRIRKAVEYLQRELESPRPLLDRTMETDGIDVFTRHLGTLVNATKQGQVALPDVLHAFLRRIDRDPRGVPVRLFPFTRTKIDVEQAPRLISMDPSVAFGRPVIAGSRVPTREVYERYMRGESNVELADDFGRTTEEIDEAVRLESGRTHAAA